MSDSIKIMYLAKESNLEQQAIIDEVKELGVFEKVSKYTELTRDQADTILESIRRRRRAAILETQVQGGAMIRRKVATAPVEKTEETVAVAPAPRKRRVTSKEAVEEAPPPGTDETGNDGHDEPRTRLSTRKPKVVEEEAAPEADPETGIEQTPMVEESLPEPQLNTQADDEVPAPVIEPVSVVVEPVVVVEPEAPLPVEEPVAVVVEPVAVSPEPEVPVVPVVPEAPAAPPAEDDSKHAAKRFLPSSARPEASASPIEKPVAAVRPGARTATPAGARPGGVAVGPKEEKKLGPTGRFIVLPTPGSRTATRVDGVAKPGEDPNAPKPPDGRASYKEKRQEEMLLRKTGYMRHKKVESVRPALPPEGKRKIKVDEFISVSELAKQMGLKGTELMKKLLSLGQMVTINSTLDLETSTIVASEWGYEIENVAFQEEKFFSEAETSTENREKRPPIVTIMGHVDHGKTSLLDAIRKSDIASKESGGITQHIGAYKVKTKEGEIVFIDTPGHEAFSAMRARGASVTDLVILVVAADDGVMPQTEEAINHCKVAKVPMLVAITKIDKHNANPQMVREKLTAYGLVDEQWGGENIMVEVSAVTKQGVDTMLEMILLQSDMLELSANATSPARAVVLEAELDRAKGPVVNLLVIDGTLSLGDHVVCGLAGGKVRALTDDRGRQLKSVGPASPVEVTGFDAVPVPGDDCRTVPDEKAAKRILDRRRDEAKTKDLARKSQAKGMDAIRQAIARGEQKHLNIILKTDVQGTMEALRDALVKLSTDIVKVNVVHCGVGGINESDINLGLTAEGVIMGFRVRPDSKARHRADQENVPVHQYNVIYDMIDEVRDIMRGMLPKEKKEQQVGRIEIRQVFNIPKIGTVAGSYVVEGKVTRSSLVRVFHDNIQVFEGRLASLRRFKDDVKEVATGYECGISIEGFNDIREGDTLEIYEIVETQMEL